MADHDAGKEVFCTVADKDATSITGFENVSEARIMLAPEVCPFKLKAASKMTALVCERCTYSLVLDGIIED